MTLSDAGHTTVGWSTRNTAHLAIYYESHSYAPRVVDEVAERAEAPHDHGLPHRLDRGAAPGWPDPNAERAGGAGAALGLATGQPGEPGCGAGGDGDRAARPGGRRGALAGPGSGAERARRSGRHR